MSNKITIEGAFISLQDHSHVTTVHGIFDKVHSRSKKRDRDIDEKRVIVFGQIPSKSNFVKYKLLVTERSEEYILSKVGRGVEELYDEDMEVTFYSIDRVLHMSTYKWSVRNIKRILNMSKKIKLLCDNLPILSGEIKTAKRFLKENRVWQTGDRKSLYRDILEAARMCSKSETYFELCLYFPPHIVRICHLKDDGESISTILKTLDNWEIPSDICLYTNKNAWKYPLYDQQIIEVVEFWREHEFFVDKKYAYRYNEKGDQLFEFEKRFKIVQYALKKRHMLKKTVYTFVEKDSEFEDFEMDPYLLLHKVFYKMDATDGRDSISFEELDSLFGTAPEYCFWDDYLEALSLKGLIDRSKNRKEGQKMYFAEGYPSSEILHHDVGFVINKCMLTYVEEVLCPEKCFLQLSNWDRLVSAHHLKLDDATTTIWLFGCEYFTIPDLISALTFFSDKACKVVVHFFGHYAICNFSKHIYGLIDWFQNAKETLPLIAGCQKNPEFIAEEIMTKNLPKDQQQKLDDPSIVYVAFSRKQKMFESSLVFDLHKIGETAFYESADGEKLLSKNMRVSPGKSIISNKRFSVAVVTDIIYCNSSLRSIPQKLYNIYGKELKVEIKIGAFTEFHTPKDLVQAPVLSLSEIIHPLKKVALVGTGWPKWAVDAFKNYLCTEELYITKSFVEAENGWDTYGVCEDSVYSKIIRKDLSTQCSISNSS